MGVLDKFLNVMRLNPDDDDFYEEEYYEDDYQEEPKPKTSHKNRKTNEDYFEEVKPMREKSYKTNQKITPMRPSTKKQFPGMEVCVIKPTSVEDSREITETLLMNRTIILNLEGLDVEVAQRIIDFSSGSCFAVNGNLQKISNYIFIITPQSVDISGDFQNIMDAFDVPAMRAEL